MVPTDPDRMNTDDGMAGGNGSNDGKAKALLSNCRYLKLYFVQFSNNKNNCLSTYVDYFMENIIPK